MVTVKTICTDGLAYSQYRNKNLDYLFQKLTKIMENEGKSHVISKYLQGVTWKYRENGQIEEFTLRGDVAMHIVAGKMYDGFSVNGMDVMVGKVVTKLS